MIHIYGHTWPVRWGKPGEEKLVKVFSNCRDVELFVNGVSAGVRHRNPMDFPAAGLHWQVKFKEGPNQLRAESRGDGPQRADEISVIYQTATWGKPAWLVLRETTRINGLVTVEVRAFDKDGVFCPDAANLVRFDLAGDGRLLDNLGTVRGSRAVQLANGRAQISLQLSGRKAVVSVTGQDFDTQFLDVADVDRRQTARRNVIP